jgi:hypothetical protein
VAITRDEEGEEQAGDGHGQRQGQGRGERPPGRHLDRDQDRADQRGAEGGPDVGDAARQTRDLALIGVSEGGLIMSAAMTSVNSVIAVCTPATVVPRSAAIAPMATFTLVAA